ncbi:MAG: PKD domain-containing protein, partial [Thermoplasmata archaeon]
KWHDSSLHVYGDGIEVLNLTVYRVPGQPDVEVARGLVLDATKNWSFYANCSFEDDVVNGNENGASPVWLNISFGDSSELLHHTFVWSPGHTDTEWRGDLNPLLHKHPVLLQAHARDRGNDVLAFAWDFGDGNSTVHFYQKEGRDIVRHVYSQPGNYCVKLTVEDDEGAVATATLWLKWEGYGVSVPNLPPVADFVIWNGANESVSEILEGTDVWLISNAYDPEYQPISVFWFFGDGTTSSELVNRKVYNAGVYNITLYVSDGYTTSVVTKTLHVKNALPAVTIEGITDCTEGFAYYYNANVSAAITDWNLEYQWALNGMPVGNRNTTRILFSTAGTYRLTLTVRDDEGSLVTAELFVNVSELMPEIFYVSEMELYTNTVVLAPAVFDTPSNYANLTVTYTLVRFNDTVVNAVVGSGRVFEYNATVKGTGKHEIGICVSDGHATACLNLTLRLHCDSDSDGMPDEWEWKYGLNWRTNDSKGDADADGLTNLEEYGFCTDPMNPDTDNDGLSDYAEVKEWLLQPHKPDCDEDGLNDSTEVLGLFYYGNYRLNIVLLGSESERNASLPLLPGIYSCTIFGNASSTTNLVVTAGNTSTVFNVSGDFNCSFRFAAETLTFSITNNTTVLLSNAEVYRTGSNPKCRHSDYDMLSDAEEFSLGLSPVKNDTDDDGVWDRAELELGLDPLNPDFDGDNATDGLEVYYGTDPFRKNSDHDELDDGLELAFVPLYVFTVSEMRSTTRNPGNATITVKLPDECIYKVSIVLAGALPSVYLNGTEVTLDVIGNTAVHAFHGYAGNLTVSIDGDFQSCTVLRFGINPFGEDYDNDGLNDGAEVYFNSSPFFNDTDEDGLNDSMEYNFHTHPRSNDSDSDGLSDYEEVMLGLNSLEADTDSDGFSDGAEFNYWNKTLRNATASALRCKNPDVDNDSMPDGWEIQNGLNPNSDDASGDADNDGLSNVGEWNLDANPKASDTDCDALSDGAEVGNCIFRTNIAEGARSIGNYSNSSGWIWWNWSKYVFASESAWNETPELLFALGDGGIYINRTRNKLIIVSGLENG